ncbi:AAA domain-containing protein [Nocardia sp. NPDC020380]|uniref:bifunctional RecB family nuclease/DEAD/DEAH box helicase n=1 Tax=Nocardia sp. NPDC020380 TaxID=3364309 RepID=UPI003791AD4F
MILFGDRVVCSTGDLVAAARCEFALLRALDAELGLVPPVEFEATPHPEPAPESDTAAERRLADLRDRYGTGTVRIRVRDTAAETAAARATDAAAARATHASAAHHITNTATARTTGAAAASTRDPAATLIADAAAAQAIDVAVTAGATAAAVGAGPVVTAGAAPGTPDAATAIAALRVAHEQTLAALGAGADAVAGAVVLDGGFAARCDFLLRDHTPETHDYLPAAVATRATKITALLGLAAMAEALRHSDFRPAPHARLWVDGRPRTYLLSDIAVVHQARRARLDLIVDTKLGELLPVQWGDRRFLACGNCPVCNAELLTRRDLLLVAGMRPATRAQLRDAGITTVDRLAAAELTVAGVPAPAFATLRRQAELQLQRERTGHPTHTLADATALAALPRPTTADLFLSVRPLTGPPTTDLGELPGDLIITIRSAKASVRHLETAARNADSPAGIYHGSGRQAHMGTPDQLPGEAAEGAGPSTARAYSGPGAAGIPAEPIGAVDPAAQPSGSTAIPPEGATGQRAEAADWGSAAVTTAELPVFGSELQTRTLGFEPAPAAEWAVTVRRFVIRTEGRAEADGGGVGPGAGDDGDALLEFLVQRQRERPELRIHHYRGAVRWLLSLLGERRSDGEDLVAELLPALVDLYPIVRAALIVGERSYDLHQLPPNQGESEQGAEAVLRLRDWLLSQGAEHGVQPVRRWAYDYAETGPEEIEAALREFAESEPEPCEAQVAAAFTAAALGYHRRERRPLRWAHDDRLDHPVDEWADTPGVLVADWSTVDTGWHSTSRGMRRYLTLTGRLGTGNAPAPGTPVLTLYDRPAPGMSAAPGHRATAYATVLGCTLDGSFADAVRLVEFLPDGCQPYDELPTAIAPCPPGTDVYLEEALEDTAHHLLVTLPQVPETAVFDILCRRPPRLLAGEALPEVFGDHAAAVTAAVLDLADSYVAVQGPPGTGKTDTTARVVERLVTRYKWRVGVVARAHAVVEHVLDAVVEVGVLPELVAKADARAVAPEWLPIEPARYARFLDNAVNGCVVGGLPRDFTDSDRVPRDSLDLLVVVDAGKFPLADAAAVAVCARNLLLVGDPAPLDGYGVHPEAVDESVLGRVVGAHRTLPAGYGYFLDRTWRMHPRMSGPVSRLRYDNRLRSNETVTLARELDGIPPGVRTVTVEHHGNSTESAEEAREIVRQVRTLLGLPWHTGAVTRRLHPHDILVVAPYHAQVARIRTLLSRARIEDVLVGTPDHFQGREAAVVLVSMTTSAPKDAPHGIAPLLSRHWLTSAISRAMWSAVIVRSPLLTEYLPATTAELSDLAAVLQLDRV